MNLLALATIGAGVYVTPGTAGFNNDQNFRSVGVFGSFGRGTELQERDNCGLLTFLIKKDLPDNTLAWSNYFGSKDLTLGHASVPGSSEGKSFQVNDWTCARLQSPAVTASFPRTFPAVLYKVTGSRWAWKPGDYPFDHLALRDKEGRLVVKSLGDDIPAMGSPWVVVWNAPKEGQETVPIFIRLQHRPTKVTFGQDLSFEFEHAADHVVVGPLFGIRRPSAEETKTWDNKVVEAADFLSRASSKFPVGTDENYRIDESRKRVEITDRYRYDEFKDDWNTPALTIAPVPPITAMAAKNGYAVDWRGQKVQFAPIDTFLGPYAYVTGRQLSYSIPIPSARDNSLAAVEPVGDGGQKELDDVVLQNLPKREDTSDGGLNLQMKEFSQAYPLLDETTKNRLKPLLADAFTADYAQSNLQTVTDPVFNQRYLMCSKIWCANEAYDREWYAGRQLDACAEFATWIDPSLVKPNWNAIKGMYDYFRIYNDWAWSGTLSSVFAYALCGDGMNFAMEGMLGTARMAKMVGDKPMWNDATYRASKEAVNTYASFFMAQYMKDVNYVTWTDTSYDYAAKKGRYEVKRMDPADVQTGFGLDIYCDTTGIKVLRPGMFWHATAALYWDNPDLERLYADSGLYPQIYKWEYRTMPRLYPDWNDGNGIEKFGNQPLGNNLAIAHLDARANLFCQYANDLRSETAKLRNDSAPLYKVRLQQDLMTAGIPQLWSPVGATLKGATWDQKSKAFRATLNSAGPVEIQWNWRGAEGTIQELTPGPNPKAVKVNGKTVPFTGAAGGNFAVKATGPEISFEVDY